MADSAPQPSAGSFGKAALWPFALVLLVMGFALFGERGIFHLVQLHRQKAMFEQDLAEIERQNERLRKEITSLRSDRRYIERVARTELGMVREDELVFQFKGTPDGKSPDPSSHP